MRCGRIAFIMLSVVALTTEGRAGGEDHPIYDRGASGVWHRLVDLSNEHRVLHITAHPDDEHGGLLTWLSRGAGVRVALLSLTRGEAGANAIGSELFDGLGWIRAEELRLAGRYYGLDALYFTRLVDYGYSKTLTEARSKWDETDALSDIVYVIRKERPTVVVSRFRGDARDGHGQHQFAGVMSRLAFEAAGDPERFPEHFDDGLEPWQPLKLYAGGYREDEPWAVAVDTSVYSPWLGDTFENVARVGLSLQRSQTSGIRREVRGPFIRYYARVASHVDVPEKESSFFDGLEPSGSREAKERLERFDARAPGRIVPELSRALATASTEQRALLSQAIVEALGVVVTADAAPLGANASTRSPFAPPPTMAPPVPGQSFEVTVTAEIASPGTFEPEVSRTRLEAPPGWRVTDSGGGAFAVHVPADARTWSPHVSRRSLHESRYEAAGEWSRGAPAPPLVAVVELRVEQQTIEIRRPVTRLESTMPYGHSRRELVVLPEISLRISPDVAIVRDGAALSVEVTRRSGSPEVLTGELVLDLPEGVTANPVSRKVGLREGSQSVDFSLTAAPGFDGAAGARAVLRTAERSYEETIDPIEHRDLETRYLVSPASALVLATRPRIAPGLRVGYVMGVGDAVPEAIEQLGAVVSSLDAEALASGDLDAFDAVVIGTRAYAVRADLRDHNARLLDYAERGGNLIVLYNTPELVPSAHAPYPGELPARSEEVSEEDAPVRFLASEAKVLRWPNRLDVADFDGWVEQRGSKFWSEWSDDYVALVESHDREQAPQRGGWLQARYGDGYYTYCAYALHRQLPYGVPGAYRILANLLSLGRAEAPASPRR